MAPPISVTIIYNKANTYGLTDDIQVIERILKKLQDSIHHPIYKPRTVDMREPMTHSDINIHLEIPVFSAISWAHTNIMLVNPEQWSYSYDAYVHAFDALLFRDSVAADTFRKDFSSKGISTDNIFVVPWSAAWQVKDLPINKSPKNEFVCFLAGSTSKFEYMRKLLPYWTSTDPILTVYTTRDDFSDELLSLGLPKNIKIVCEDLSLQKRQKLMTEHRGHIICSQGEAFGYAAANAEVCGAFTIMNRLPVFEADYDGSNLQGNAWLSNTYSLSDKVRYSIASPSTECHNELKKAFDMFSQANFDDICHIRQKKAQSRFENTCSAFLNVFTPIYEQIKERRPTSGHYHCPPVLHLDDCPPISIITPTYNRKKLFEIAFHNLLLTDYPKDKIEWIVIEDNEKTPHMVGEALMSFQVQLPQIKIKYIPIEGRMTIGEKRNHAIENASNDIILFMDDDDHYPETSFRRRVAWLTKSTKRGLTANIACCTTIALYDLKRGISAVNVPPYEIPFAQRISEATLTFRKSAWLERKFPSVSIAEGEEWITGREDQVIEIPPQQIIVAFSHDSNQSSRRIPPSDQKPACFWGFPKEYLIFVHGLVNVEIEDDKKSKR